MLCVQAESWEDNLEEQLSRLATFIGRPELSGNTDVLEGVRDMLDASLWHYRTSPRALSSVLERYNGIVDNPAAGLPFAGADFQAMLDELGREAMVSDRLKMHREKEHWTEQLALAESELENVVPSGVNYILVDDDLFGAHFAADRTSIPFIERDGTYYGPPEDASAAIRELERLHKLGAAFIVFGWPTYWWFEHYPEFNRHLRSNYRCLVHNERLVVFDLKA